MYTMLFCCAEVMGRAKRCSNLRRDGVTVAEGESGGTRGTSCRDFLCCPLLDSRALNGLFWELTV